MKDTRNVERGACTKCESCLEYGTDDKATSASCNYCFCPPTVHHVISATETSNQAASTSTSNNTSLASNSSLTETPVSQASDIVTLSIGNVTDPFLKSLLIQRSSSDEPNTDEIFLPVKLPRKCEVALEKRDVDHKVKSNIVREVVSNLIGHDQTTTKCLEKAAKKMVTKWSPLKDVNDPDNFGLVTMLRKRRDRCNREETAAGASTSRSNNAEMTALEAKKEMLEQWTANHRTAAAHKRLMEIARPQRKLDSKKLPGLQLLKAYPALGINDILLQELFVELETTEDKVRDMWKKTMIPLKRYHQTERRLPFVDGTLDEETLWILENIHMYHTWFKEVNREKRNARVLELFPENTPPAEAQPKASEAPRLIGIGSHANGTLSLSSFVDSEPVFSEDNPFRAMLLLLALYFVIDIKWPPLLRLPLIFLTCAIGCLKKVRGDVVRNQKLVTFLRQMDCYD